MSVDKMVEVIIDSVRVSLTNQQRIVVLREINTERYLPIWIGPYEAESITIALQEIEVSRPQTHDLVKNLLNQLNARILRVEVLSLKDDVFYGILVVECNEQIVEIDSRPSDALAIAARTHSKILVSEEVMGIAGIVPEMDIHEQDEETSQNQQKNETADDEIESEERLSVFEDFLGSLDIGGMDDLDSPEEPPEDQDPQL
ncbi:MAG: bifunctional nuclease family protein [Anaerolineaceae bacterium]|nr:bifunctional nuclease family protein [Anaerolineaceae bacterium]